MHFSRRQFLASASVAVTAACTPAIHPSRDADIIILGAGLAGLHAARMLAADGAKVLVLEAANRVGGRLKTLNDMPGSPEAGGQQVGQSYARIRSTALDLGIAIAPPPPGGSRAKTLVMNDTVFDARDWAASPFNPFPEAFKRATPDSALFMAAAPTNPLQDQQAWREIGPEHDIDAGTFLMQQGFNAAARDLCDVALNANALESYSMLNLYRSLTLFAQDSSSGPSEDIVGGAQRLPEAMAASFPEGSVRLNTPVTSITANEHGTEIVAGGQTFRAPYAICALPYPALDDIDLIAPISAPQAKAIKLLPYTQIQQVHLTLETLPGDDLPLMMWTDREIERVFPVRDESGETVALTCWINGAGIQRDVSDEEWKALAEQILAETRGIKASARHVIRWDADQPLSGGAYMHWAPGQIGDWAEAMLAPAGRLHFAGEHLSHLHTGMEGAMESAERAAFEIADAAAAQAP